MASTGEPSADARWVPALVIESKTTPQQRERNRALYLRLRDGQISPRTGVQEVGLSSFVYDVPIERLSVGPAGKSFSFRLDKSDECFRRLLSVISDHFDERCDADDEVERLRARVVELEARIAGRGGV